MGYGLAAAVALAHAAAYVLNEYFPCAHYRR